VEEAQAGVAAGVPGQVSRWPHDVQAAVQRALQAGVLPPRTGLHWVGCNCTRGIFILSRGAALTRL
jgi:hypothetical protein